MHQIHLASLRYRDTHSQTVSRRYCYDTNSVMHMVTRSYQHWTTVLCDHWLIAQDQWTITYDNLPPIVYIGSGLAPGSAMPEKGGQRNRTTDTTA
jgi:hypothetical protein